MARKKWRSGSVTVDVEVFIEDVLEEIDDDRLIEELRDRKKLPANVSDEERDVLVELRHLLCRGDLNGALALVERELWPRRDVEALYAKAPKFKDALKPI